MSFTICHVDELHESVRARREMSATDQYVLNFANDFTGEAEFTTRDGHTFRLFTGNIVLTDAPLSKRDRSKLEQAGGIIVDLTSDHVLYYSDCTDACAAWNEL